MKIAYLLNQYPMPSQTFIRREIAAVERCGWEVVRYSLRSWDGRLVDAEDIDEHRRTRSVLGRGGPLRLCVAVLAAAMHRPRALCRALRRTVALGRHSQRGLAMHLVYLAEACVLVRWMDEADVAHVHTHFGTNGPVVALLVHALGGPEFSFTVHGPEEFDSPEALKLGAKVREAAFVVVISSFGRSQMMRWSDPRDWSKLHVVRCGLDDTFLDVPTSPTPDVTRVVSVGRLSEQKGQLVLVEAVGRLLQEEVDVELVLIGDGPLRDDLEAMITKLGAGSAITLAGWQDSESVRRAIEHSRAFVLPSFAEGLPVALMEALALGRVVVTSAVAGIPELVDAECGYVVPAGSVERAAEALRSILATPVARLDEMAAVGRSRVIAMHDVDVEAAKLMELITSTHAARQSDSLEL